jgi:hypothetical protein
MFPLAQREADPSSEGDWESGTKLLSPLQFRPSLCSEPQTPALLLEVGMLAGGEWSALTTNLTRA